MARTLRFPARVNIVVPQETYDAYKEAADLLDLTLPQLMRDMLEGALPNVRMLAEAARVAKQQSPLAAGEMLMKYFGGIQAELEQVNAEGREFLDEQRRQQQQPKQKAS